MKKMFIVMNVLSLLTSSISARTWWDDISSSYDFEYNDSIDFAAIQRIIGQEMDRLFQPHSQTLVNRNYINEMKEYAKKEISKTIRNSCSTHTQAKKQATRLTEEFAVDVVVEWAVHSAREQLKNPPVNPMYINQHDIISAVRHIVRSQAQLALREDRRLTKTVQNLGENVRIIIEQEIKIALDW